VTKATILFADNDLDFLRTRAEFLEQEGYRVILAADPTEARRVLEQGGIDLAILDIRLLNDDDEKDTSGLTLAKEVARAVPKFILTGFPSVDAVREALQTQLDGLPAAVDFVSKQEGAEELLRVIKETLASQPMALRSKRAWVRQVSGLFALVALFLAIGAGIVAVVVSDPRWLLATVFLAILVVVGAGLAVFMPEE
jgi:DNA-binding NtrC family response regulator